jgi:PD-(D/E)XK endonuclease
MTTNQKGAIAETAVVHAAIKLGIDVYHPVMEGGRLDLVLDLDRRLVRVQCKWAARHGDVIVVRCGSCRRTRDGLLHRSYTANEIDAFAAYSVDTDCCYYLPLERFPHSRSIQLRLGPTRNNQRQRVNWAGDFEFAARLGGYGAVAQLGERDAGSVEARGSNPLGSTL